MYTFYNAITFNTAPTLSGANITAGTIPVASFTPTATVLADNVTWSGVQTFQSQPVTSFATSPTSTNLFYIYKTGAAVLSGANDTCFGYRAGEAITSGTQNTYFGNLTGRGTTTLSNSTALGPSSCLSGTSYTGNSNTIIGDACASSMTTSNNSTCFGRGCFQSVVTTQNQCVALGSTAYGSGSTPAVAGFAIGASAQPGLSSRQVFGRANETVYCPGTSTTLGSLQLLGPSSSILTATSVGGSTSGTAVFAPIYLGSSYKKIFIKCSSLVGTASYTFPVAFSFTPVVINTANAIAGGGANSIAVTAITTGSGALSTTAVTVDCGAGPTTGFLILEGY